MSMSAHPALVLNADFRPMSYFSALAAVVAGGGQRRVQRTGLGGGRVRRLGAQPFDADPAATFNTAE